MICLNWINDNCFHSHTINISNVLIIDSFFFYEPSGHLNRSRSASVLTGPLASSAGEMRDSESLFLLFVGVFVLSSRPVSGCPLGVGKRPDCASCFFLFLPLYLLSHTSCHLASRNRLWYLDPVVQLVTLELISTHVGIRGRQFFFFFHVVCVFDKKQGLIDCPID